MDVAQFITEACEHYDLIPVGPDSKATLVKWKDRRFSKDQLLFHARRGGNIGARVGMTRSGIQVLVIDRDGRDMESWKAVQRYGIAHRSNMVAVTASGNAHYWFRLEKAVEDLHTKIRLLVEGKKLPVDVKATGYVLLPGSKIGGKEYRAKEGKGLKKPAELNPLPASFLELLAKPAIENKVGTESATNSNKIGTAIESVRKYVSFIIARNHSGAHDQAFRCACKIAERVQNFGTAMMIFREWNLTNAVDQDGTTLYPFSESELLHKMTDAYRVARRK